LLESKLMSSWDTSPLLELLSADYLVGVVLLRLGRFSVAVYQGDRLVASKTDARYVKGRHRAGGSSQRRFERIREGQMRRIYDKTCEATATQFEPFAKQLDYVVLGGERITLNNFRKVCPYLDRFQGKVLDRRLNIRDPKRDTLEEVGRLLWQSRVYPVQF
jgi:peptide subunit release factor 1 (eRF1)